MSNINGTYTAERQPKGFEELTVSSSAAGFDSIPPFATRAVVGVEGGDVRFRDDGEDPASDAGFLVAEGDVFELPSKESIENFKAIRDGGEDVTLNILYYSTQS